ncbi:MAG: pyridoxamine 5'-phosphate oxidase family protein [Patescibacteria group bacterium]|nr:pyridoxamine 5'-phosphate oxidase family protein [Patescibacteria group bacterium]
MDESSEDYLKIISYINRHPAAVISTTNDDGTPQSSVVYVFSVSHHTVSFVTRNLTHKYQNIFDRPKVSITFFDERDITTLQITGTAFIANDEHMLTYTIQKIEKLFNVRADAVSPVAKMQQSGDYVLIGVEMKKAVLTEFQGIDVNISSSYDVTTIGS